MYIYITYYINSLVLMLLISVLYPAKMDTWNMQNLSKTVDKLVILISTEKPHILINMVIIIACLILCSYVYRD